jgi:tetratricopeptide (TPR) repeat protein
MTLAGIPLRGVSIAGRETWFRVPSLDLAFDVGRSPAEIVPAPSLFLSHAHLDHAGGLAYWASQRRLLRLAPARVFADPATVPSWRQILALHAGLEGVEYHVAVEGLASGDTVDLRRDLSVTAFRVDHRVPTLGFVASEVRRRLVPAWQGRSEDDIRAALSRGEPVTQRSPRPLVAFSGDTGIGFFSSAPREAFEAFRQRLAADGFPDRLEELAGENPKTLTEEARKILKDVESWAEQGGVEDASILHTLALVDYSRGDVERARLRLRKAARTSSDALLFENLGDLYRISGKVRTALENYKIAAKTAPETSPVHRKLGLALYDAKDFGAAVKPLKVALEQHKEDPDLHLKTARALLASGDFQGTVEVAQAAGRKFPKDPLLPSCAILAYGRMKKFRDAQKTFEKAVEIDPKSADVHLAHGMALLDEGKLPEASEAFRTALECDASRPEAHYGLGLAANRDLAFDTALGHLKKSVGLKPDYAEAWYAMKTTYEGLKKFEAAVEALNKAIALNPRLSA